MRGNFIASSSVKFGNFPSFDCVCIWNIDRYVFATSPFLLHTVLPMPAGHITKEALALVFDNVLVSTL